MGRSKLKNKNAKNKPKILLLDIETSPNLAYCWGLFSEITSTEMIAKEWYIMCVCAKWLGSSEVMSFALPDYSMYKKDPENDINIMKDVWKLLDEADIIIGHNCGDFDLKKIKTRFLYHGINPPSPYKIVDTLKVARGAFSMTSNKLNDLCKYLKIGEKIDAGGFKLWKQCIHQDKIAWSKMVKYCKQDVILLEKMYLKMLPYIKNHPHIGAYIDDERPMCTNCGSVKLQKMGMAVNAGAVYQRLMCQECGAWMRESKNLKKKEKVRLYSN